MKFMPLRKKGLHLIEFISYWNDKNIDAHNTQIRRPQALMIPV